MILKLISMAEDGEQQEAVMKRGEMGILFCDYCMYSFSAFGHSNRRHPYSNNLRGN